MFQWQCSSANVFCANRRKFVPPHVALGLSHVFRFTTRFVSEQRLAIVLMLFILLPPCFNLCNTTAYIRSILSWYRDILSSNTSDECTGFDNDQSFKMFRLEMVLECVFVYSSSMWWTRISSVFIRRTFHIFKWNVLANVVPYYILYYIRFN